MAAIVRGADGCAVGWLCASTDLETRKVSAEIFPDALSLFAANPSAVTAVDIPIGLPNIRARACGREARALLGARASSVFPAPVRAALASDSYESACAASAAVCGKRLSKQTYAILPKIRNVDVALRQSPELLTTVFEVHPEVCFYFWNKRAAMRHPKHSGFGFADRYRLVEGAFGGAAEQIRCTLSRTEVSDDDILDALAALWTARRIHSGTAERLPQSEERDECGLPMQMLA